MTGLDLDTIAGLRAILWRDWLLAPDLTAGQVDGLAIAARILEGRQDATPKDHFFAAQVAELSGDRVSLFDRFTRTGLACGANRDLYDWDLWIAVNEHGRRRAEAMRAAGMVPPLIVSLPKSASDSLSTAVAGVVGLATGRISKGVFRQAIAVPGWVSGFSAGGFCTHDHLPASDHNVACLAAGGFDRMVLQVREPADAALSLFRMIDKLDENLIGRLFFNLTGDEAFIDRAGMTTEERLERLVPVLHRWMVDWLRGWLAVLRAPPAGLRVKVQRYEEFHEDPPGAVRDTVAYFGHSNDDPAATDAVIRDTLDYHWATIGTARRAVVGAWRDEVPRRTQALLAGQSDPEVYDAFDWPLVA